LPTYLLTPRTLHHTKSSRATFPDARQHEKSPPPDLWFCECQDGSDEELLQCEVEEGLREAAAADALEGVDTPSTREINGKFSTA
jgi:hypothetical protein